jgi:predicted methyltransferase
MQKENAMFRHILKPAALALSVATLIAAAASPLTSPPRPEADTKRDADRKPLDMLAFAKVKSGQTVVDFLPGGGYFTRLFSAVVGPRGQVIADEPETAAKRFPDQVKALNALAAEPGRSNIKVVVSTDGGFGAPGSADLIWTAQNYHDLHNIPGNMFARINLAVFSALKHGGYFVVLDHAAAAGSGARDTSTLHRIDPAAVKAEVLAAGFVLDGESNILANPADDHARNVFDPNVRGHTDQFVYRFRKP